MSKKILLIEADGAFASELSAALEGHGYRVRVTGDGKEGLALARDDRPDAVVLCVELQNVSGYSICKKLKNDEVLRTIPLVLTSAEATPDTFEQHSKLKARADEYLLKPFAPQVLARKISALVGLPDSAEDDVVTLEEEMAIEPLGDEVSALPPIDLSDPSDLTPAAAEQEEEFKLLDDAFENIAGVPETPSPEPDGGQEWVTPESTIAHLRASREEARKAAERAAAVERELAAAAERELASSRDRLEKVDRQLASLATRLDQAERALRDKNAEAAQSAEQVEMLKRELDRVESELVAARNDAEEARAETERRSAELVKRISELEAENARSEERAVKSYQKIKMDEKIREKTRKALTIALQLLDESFAPGDAAENGPRPVAMGRD